MQGQANHFTRELVPFSPLVRQVKDSKLSHIAGYAPEKIPYGIARYQNETRRLYRVLDTALAASESGYLVGDRVTIADISSWGWVASASESTTDTPSLHSPLCAISVLTVVINERLLWRGHR